MPKKVTYGVSGLLDWNAVIHVGKARLNVHFSGGSFTKYGSFPAEYTTTDPIVQRIIEDSQYYRTGRIKTLRSVGRHEATPLSRKNSLEAQNAYVNATLPFDNAAQPEPTPAPTEMQVIEMDCIEDAIEYMREKFNISSSALHSLEAIQKNAAIHNIRFVINP